MQRVENKRLSSDSNSSSAGGNQPRKKMATERGISTRKNDIYCWSCHRDGMMMHCEVCPRSFHLKCTNGEKLSNDDWVCPECEIIMKAENVDSRSAAMKSLTVDQLCSLLKFALMRIKYHCPEEFQKPVPLEEFPNYPDFVVHPMDLETLENNIKKKVYGCTESFLADVKWILHNCILFNGYQHKLTGIAKNLVKVCKHEMNEIEICPDCYYNAYTKRDNWFQEPCCPPHLLIWAKLKGFPFWPAKAMKISSGMIDVRFFGAHDRAWIPVSQCFLLSATAPATMKMKVKRKGVFEQSMEELAGHIAKLKENYNAFQYSSPKASLQSEDLLSHVETMLPGVNVKEIRRSFMLDRIIQPRFFSGKKIKSEREDDAQLTLKEMECGSSSNVSTPGVIKQSQLCLESIRNLESAMVKIKALEEYAELENVISSDERKNVSATEFVSEQKKNENSIKIHLKRAEPMSDSKDTVWETKTDIEPKQSGDTSVDSAMEIGENESCEEKEITTDLMQKNGTEESDKNLTISECKEPASDSRGEIDVNIGDALNSLLEEEHNNVETVHVQLLKPTVDSSQTAVSDSEQVERRTSNDEVEAQEPAPVISANEEEVEKAKLSDAEKAKSSDAVEGDSLMKTDSSDDYSPDQDDLVIDLDLKPNIVTRRVNKRKLAVPNRKIPFGKIKLKELSSSAEIKTETRSQEESTERNFNEKQFKADPKIYSMLPKLFPKNCNSDRNQASASKTGNTRSTPKLLPRPGLLGNNLNRKISADNNLTKYSRKVVDFMHGTMEEMFRDLAKSGNSDQVTIQILQMEMERMRWLHNQEIAELKHNNDLVLLEMRNSLEYEKQRAIAEVLSQCQLEKQKAIEETKRKQWCAFCGKEAFYYCCWSTSYCDYPCQQAHWPHHSNNCVQQEL